jgi:peptide/nickel transport system substrate-binding protein
VSRAVRSPLRGRKLYTWSTAATVAALVAAAGCGSSSSSSPSAAKTAGAQKGGTYTILANAAFGVADPAQNYTLQEWQLLIDTHDGLVQFKRVGGAAGTKLVPDLATSIPQPTNGGKTYVFHIRKGIKFSNGQVMKPSDFVTTFERQFTVPGPTSFYAGIVGADKCSTKGCDLSQGVVADDSASTLTINLAAAATRVPPEAGAAVRLRGPADTSKKLTGNNVPPGTGPYMWQSYSPNSQAVLVRNPYFHSGARRPSPTGTRTRSSRSTARRSPMR